ncbi:MAG: 16S rRNA (guanine(527)-N(7))-methyltransferase RsmG, partial [bacterium]
MDKEKFSELLNDGLVKMGLQFREDLTENLYEYMNFLLQENKKFNLTSIDTPEDVISKHFLDSLVFFNSFNPEKGTKVIDVGTGAGFPGLVLKIYRPDLDIVLIDSLKKRVNFLNELIDMLGLAGIEALHTRAEEIGNNKLYREKFTLAVSRAVASINILSEYTIPF